MSKLLFRQLIHDGTKTNTYILGDTSTKECIVIDSVFGEEDKLLRYLDELGMKIKYLVETHVHAEHITAAMTFLVNKKVEAEVIYGINSGVDKNVIKNLRLVKEGDFIEFGGFKLKCFETPGHTSGCMCYHLPSSQYGYSSDMIFTGDLLFIRKCGRTDFQGGSARIMHASVSKLYKNLKDSCLVYPGHDYNGFVSSSIGEEKKYSIRVNEKVTVDQFEKMMSDILKHMSLPAKLHLAVPANLNGGILAAQKMYSYFYVTGFLSELSVKTMKKKNDIGTLINIVPRTAPGSYDAEDVCKEMGMTYYYMPMTPSTISDEKLEGFMMFLGGLFAQKKNFCVSCTSENRSRFLAYYYCLKKVTDPKVNADLENIISGIKSPALVEYLIGDMKMDIGEFLKTKSSGKKSAEAVCSAETKSKGSGMPECGM